MQQGSIKSESIGAGITVFTSPQHAFGTDAILLADFAAPKKSDIACDLGSGCGIIPFLWARYDAPASITALELQEDAVALIRKSIAHNGLQERITALHADLREVEALHTFSLVTMNPPYFPLHSGYRNAELSHEHARHEITCTSEDVVSAADKLLRYGGRLCMCQKPERLADCICAMRAHDIEPKRLRFVCGRQGKDPYLVLLEGKKGGGKSLKVMKELWVQTANGNYSTEMIKIYKDYGDGTKQ